MKPSVITFDLDETLVYFDENCNCFFSPRYYIREYSNQLLNLLRQINKNNLIVLWTAAKDPYVTDVLFQSYLGSYFNFILTRKHCKESYKIYGAQKHADYLLRYLSRKFDKNEMYKIKQYDFLLIDDKANLNGNSSYDFELNAKPYTFDTVQKELSNNSYRDDYLLSLCGFFFDKCFLRYFDNNKLIYLNKNI